ncbi:ABC transporter substrate-binding protein [Halostella sp. JP-L12]|uniref:PGF-CTERM-anchored ABC transporter substrate-binding protein n=1 Tax=Halostella TaxID=1843185 RepID=UPI000EF82939|nr:MULTISPECIES: PGF-CTERM-anchored ABC transporter substrate-binding protein [Halostella]NHN49704.1 ABC transporter substrate-binding protein [Halostella sp. JP-L12]
MLRDGLRLLVALLVVTAGVGAVATTAGAQTAQDAPTAATTGASTDAAQNDDCTFPVTLEDAKGTEVTIEERPESVVALQPSAAQTMWAIGAEAQVTGMPVSRYTDYLDGSEDKTDISQNDGVSISAETVVSLEADLLLAPNSTPDETIAQFRDVGMTVYEFREAESVEDIYEKTNRTGRLTGNCEGAAEAVAEMRTEIEVVQEAVSGEEPETVYYQMGGGYTAGADTFINHVIELGGGENIAVAANVTGYAQLSGEVIAEQNPEWVLVNEEMGLQETEALANTTALREDQIIEVNANYLNQPGPRVVVPISEIAQAIHPEAYEEANVSVRGEAEAEAEAEAGGNDSDGTTADDANDSGGESDNDGQPGMGVAPAVAALVGTLALLTRRRD